MESGPLAVGESESEFFGWVVGQLGRSRGVNSLRA